MNAVEIEEAVSELFAAPLDAPAFPWAFLEAFGNKKTTLDRLKKGTTNKTDIPGAVLQRNNIHLHVCEPDTVDAALAALCDSPATHKQKAKFVLATDGQTVQAQNLVDDTEPPLVCDWADLPHHFGYFLALAGISTVRQIRENAFDIKATGRLNKLYIELLGHNPPWSAADRREDLNHFLARLIFCFFAEDTGIFRGRGVAPGEGLFSKTVEQMSERDGSNTHSVIAECFRAMDTPLSERQQAKLPTWADGFPYVNGGLFSGSRGGTDVPAFTRIARSYLIHIGSLDWTKINPDIFGSMIQAVADDDERGALGMHYTSVPNILKVLNPLFLDDLRQKLDDAGDGSSPGSKRKLLNLRDRIKRIRVFDPACGSGNFLVIAYKEMRAIEAQINQRRGEPDRRTDIPPTNFYGIELRHFPAEIARLALVIAEYQCDVTHRGETLARAEFLPLDQENWITCGNALRIDWLSVCPPTGTSVKVEGDDLFSTPLDQAEIDFENEGGETYICGNPPYLGSRRQDKSHKDEIKEIAGPYEKKWRSLDYSSAWVFRARDYQRKERSVFAFVTTSSLNEGLHVSLLWRHIVTGESKIVFAHRPFKWTNLAKGNAGVSVVVVGVSNFERQATLSVFDGDEKIRCKNINAYLANGPDVYVLTSTRQISSMATMLTGAMPRDGGHLILSGQEKLQTTLQQPLASDYMRRYIGSEELITGKVRHCIWVADELAAMASGIEVLSNRFEKVRSSRLKSTLQSTIDSAKTPHRFVYLAGKSEIMTVAIGAVSSESRQYLPVDCLSPDAVCSNRVYAIYDGTAVDFSLLSSSIHLAWVCAICGRLEQRISYSNTLGWNTFPVPPLTDQHKADLTRCAEDILLARESYWPATIADMYDPNRMDEEFPEVRAAHQRNDETLERIYIGRRFKNDTERLEKLFAMYTKMTAQADGAKKTPAKRKKKAAKK